MTATTTRIEATERRVRLFPGRYRASTRVAIYQTLRGQDLGYREIATGEEFELPDLEHGGCHLLDTNLADDACGPDDLVPAIVELLG